MLKRALNALKKTLKAFSIILKNPWLLNCILEDNSVWEKYVAKKYPAFKKGLPVVDINDLIPGFKETLDTVVYLGGGSTVPDLCIIKAFCKSVPNCTYFELGTWMGESVANASEVCSDCVTLNLDPAVYAKGKYKDVMGFFSKKLKNVKQLYGDSLTFDFGGLNKKFDVVFIDADHHYQYIVNDSSKVFANLLHDKSTVIWHDYGFDPGYIRYQTLAAILDGIPEELHKNLYHVSNSLCAIYSASKLPSKEPQSPVIPGKKFKVSIEALPV